MSFISNLPGDTPSTKPVTPPAKPVTPPAASVEVKSTSAVAPAIIASTPPVNGNEAPKPLAKYPHTFKYLTTAIQNAKAGHYKESIKTLISSSNPRTLKIDFLMRLTIGCWLKENVKKSSELKEDAKKLCPEICTELPQDQIMGDDGIDLIHSALYPLYQLPDDILDNFIACDSLPSRRATPVEKDYFGNLQELVKKVSRVAEDKLKSEIWDAVSLPPPKEASNTSPPQTPATKAVPKTPPLSPTIPSTTPPALVTKAAAQTNNIATSTLGSSLVDEVATERERKLADTKERASSIYKERNFDPPRESRDVKDEKRDVKIDPPKVIPRSKGSDVRGMMNSNSAKTDETSSNEKFIREMIDSNSNTSTNEIPAIEKFISDGKLGDAQSWIDTLQIRNLPTTKKEPLFEKLAKALIEKDDHAAARKVIDNDISDALLKATLNSLMDTKAVNIAKRLDNTRKLLVEAFAKAHESTEKEKALKRISELNNQYITKIQSEIDRRAKVKEETERALKESTAATTNANTAAAPATVQQSSTPKPIVNVPQSIEKHFGSGLGYRNSPKLGDISNVNKVKLKLIEKHLETLGMRAGKAIDNGDCFFHAFAQALNVVLRSQGKEPVTIVQLRNQVKELISKNETWLKPLCESNATVAPEKYDRFVKEILVTGDSGKIPNFGHPTREGKMLCQHYNVNLDVILGDVTGLEKTKAQKLLKKTESLAKFLEDAENRTIGKDANDCVSISGSTHTITIAGYPGHFFPVFNKADVA